MIEFSADDPLAPPRSNGEIVFDAPWQSRAFGVAVSLADAGVFPWSEFQGQLILAIERSAGLGHDTVVPEVYWTCWLDALGGVVADAVPASIWSARCGVLADRPAGHDH